MMGYGQMDMQRQNWKESVVTDRVSQSLNLSIQTEEPERSSSEDAAELEQASFSVDGTEKVENELFSEDAVGLEEEKGSVSKKAIFGGEKKFHRCPEPRTTGPGSGKLGEGHANHRIELNRRGKGYEIKSNNNHMQPEPRNHEITTADTLNQPQERRQAAANTTQKNLHKNRMDGFGS